MCFFWVLRVALQILLLACTTIWLPHHVFPQPQVQVQVHHQADFHDIGLYFMFVYISVPVKTKSQVHNQADLVKIGSILNLNLNLKLPGHISMSIFFWINKKKLTCFCLFTCNKREKSKHWLRSIVFFGGAEVGKLTLDNTKSLGNVTERRDTDWKNRWSWDVAAWCFMRVPHEKSTRTENWAKKQTKFWRKNHSE